jgi:hypothetical protein
MTVNTTEAQAAARARWPRTVPLTTQISKHTTTRPEMPVVRRWVNSMMVLTLGETCMTVSLQSGQWLPQPSPEPVARTSVPHKMVATK